MSPADALFFSCAFFSFHRILPGFPPSSLAPQPTPPTFAPPPPRFFVAAPGWTMPSTRLGWQALGLRHSPRAVFVGKPPFFVYSLREYGLEQEKIRFDAYFAFANDGLHSESLPQPQPFSNRPRLLRDGHAPVRRHGCNSLASSASPPASLTTSWRVLSAAGLVDFSWTPRALVFMPLRPRPPLSRAVRSGLERYRRPFGRPTSSPGCPPSMS